MAQSQDGTEFQSADILKYFEDLKRGPNTETCPPPAAWAKDIFEMASRNKKRGVTPSFFKPFSRGSYSLDDRDPSPLSV